MLSKLLVHCPSILWTICLSFDATVNCILDNAEMLSDEQFVKLQQPPAEVLIDALNVTAFAALMQTLLQLKLQQPANDTFVITDKHVSAYQSVMQSSRHLATSKIKDANSGMIHL